MSPGPAGLRASRVEVVSAITPGSTAGALRAAGAAAGHPGHLQLSAHPRGKDLSAPRATCLQLSSSLLKLEMRLLCAYILSILEIVEMLFLSRCRRKHLTLFNEFLLVLLSRLY